MGFQDVKLWKSKVIFIGKSSFGRNSKSTGKNF